MDVNSPDCKFVLLNFHAQFRKMRLTFPPHTYRTLKKSTVDLMLNYRKLYKKNCKFNDC